MHVLQAAYRSFAVDVVCLLLNRDERDAPAVTDRTAEEEPAENSFTGETPAPATNDESLSVLGSHAFLIQILLSRCSDVSAS